MQLFYNESGQIDYDADIYTASVHDLLNAINLFIEENPLACNQCQNGCCRKPWAVEVDNVCLKRLCKGSGFTPVAFVSTYLKLDENQFLDFDQYIVNKTTPHCPWVSEDNRCLIYQNRPLICRLYLCAPKTRRYNQLREAAAATYLQALVFEQIIDNQDTTPDQQKYFARNPALNAVDYNLKLKIILDYSLDEGWI